MGHSNHATEADFDRPVATLSVAEHPRADQPASDRPAADQAVPEQPAAEQPAADRPGSTTHLDPRDHLPQPAPPAPDLPRSPTGIYIAVHGHFYQPPRENSYVETIIRQPSAAPFHNWNERICHECYRPNAFARILNDYGEMVGVVNNYEWMSFNIGPTLMSWLERYDRQTYERILLGDRRSCERFGGRGNAIAQAYNHMILPLANERDKQTQIRWGLADFRQRFGRDAEGLWLAETAVDYPTLKVAIKAGVRFLVLAPSQAERCRPMPIDRAAKAAGGDRPGQTPGDGEAGSADWADSGASEPDWIQVGGGQIDPTRPYRCWVPAHYFGDPDQPGDGDQDGGDRSIDLFFYDGPISADMGFNNALESAEHFAQRLGQAVRGDRSQQLISLATDGETFGHHKRDKEKCLAWAMIHEFPRRGWLPTNFAYYLSQFPPEWEVALKPVTAWSCSHGVDRWQDDCGCGGGGGWHQRWRRPLREALNWLRDRLAQIFEQEGRRLLRDPWAARDDYIQVILDRSPANIAAFLERHSLRSAASQDPGDRSDILRLLEMQRHALLMFTSCGWFFEELSRPEGVQILRYAARAIDLAAEETGIALEAEFIRRLAAAPSNVPELADGAEIYRKLVATDRILPPQLVAAVAIETLLPAQERPQQIYAYRIEQLTYKLRRAGSLSLAVGQQDMVAETTCEQGRYIFAALHLGGWDFYCGVTTFQNRLQLTQLEERLFAAIDRGSAAEAILAIERHMGGDRFGLDDLFSEDRHRLMRRLVTETVAGLDRLYDRVYRENYGILVGFHRDGLAVPRELQAAAEISLAQRIRESLLAIQREPNLAGAAHPNTDPLTSDFLGDRGRSHLAELEALAEETSRLEGKLDLAEAATLLEQCLSRLLPVALDQLRHLLTQRNAAPAGSSPSPDQSFNQSLEMIHDLERLLNISQALTMPLWLDPLQESYWQWLHQLVAIGAIGAIDPHHLEQPNPKRPETNSAANPSQTQPAASLSQTTPQALWQRSLDLGQALGIDPQPWREMALIAVD